MSARQKAWEIIWYLANALGYGQALQDRRIASMIYNALDDQKAERLIKVINEMCRQMACQQDKK